MKTQTKESQNKLSPEQVLQMLKEGNQRFAKNLKANRNLQEQVLQTSQAQFPIATILSCMDSRTSAELIFDKGLGDIFSIRIAGNVLNDDILGSMEFGAKVIGTKIILVLGHTKCGAIIGACDGVKLGNLTQLLKKVNPAIESEKQTKNNRSGSNDKFVANVTINNIHLVIAQIKEYSSIISDLENQGDVKIVGGLYDVTTGEIIFY